MKKYLTLSLICLLTLCGCGEVPKLQNGEEAVISFKKGDTEHKISAEELYEELKANFGLEATLKVIDTYILEKEFADYIDTAKENASAYIDSYIESYGGEDEFLLALMQNTNYTTIEGYEDYFYLSFMQSHSIEEYAKSQITDKAIEKYYNDEVKGDIEIYHILITPEVTDGMSDDEVTTKENEAKTKAQDLIKRLKKSDDVLSTFKELVKEYSEDEATVSKDGNLGYINYGDLDENYDELLDAAFKLEDGDFSAEVITTELGYHVIYRNASKDKDSLDNLKEEIRETLATKLLETNTDLSLNAMKYYRELYNLEIIDSELNRQYGIYLNNLANQTTEE